MMLETLFARAGQTQAFLCLAGCGFLLGALWHLCGLLHPAHPALGAAADLGCCALLGMMLWWDLLIFGDGVRLYGLLGLMLGALMYLAGLRPVVNACLRLMRKLLKRLQRSPAPKEGFSPAGAESFTKDDPP